VTLSGILLVWLGFLVVLIAHIPRARLPLTPGLVLLPAGFGLLVLGLET